MGIGGRVPRRVDAATKSALLELLEKAVEQGWSVSAAAVVLDLGRVRAHRWMLKSPEKGARTSICLATSPDVAHVTGSTSIDARIKQNPVAGRIQVDTPNRRERRTSGASAFSMIPARCCRPPGRRSWSCRSLPGGVRNRRRS